MYNFTLKASSRDDSEGIILTFHNKWYEPLLNNDVSVVFRKTGPTWFVPKIMYAYLSSPVSAIVARMPVIKYEFLSTDEALLLADRGKIGVNELRTYARHYPSLLVIDIGTVTKAGSPITFQRLADDYGFWPSSTFIPVARSGMDTLDTLGQFDEKRRK